jgi:hypothetical protein
VNLSFEKHFLYLSLLLFSMAAHAVVCSDCQTLYCEIVEDDSSASIHKSTGKLSALCLLESKSFAKAASLQCEQPKYDNCMKTCTNPAAKPLAQTPEEVDPPPAPAVKTVPEVCLNAATAAIGLCTQNSNTFTGGGAASGNNPCAQLSTLDAYGNSYASNFVSQCQTSIQNCQSVCGASANTDQCNGAVSGLQAFNMQSQQLDTSTTNGYNGCRGTKAALSNNASSPLQSALTALIPALTGGPAITPIPVQPVMNGAVSTTGVGGGGSAASTTPTTTSATATPSAGGSSSSAASISNGALAGLMQNPVQPVPTDASKLTLGVPPAGANGLAPLGAPGAAMAAGKKSGGSFGALAMGSSKSLYGGLLTPSNSTSSSTNTLSSSSTTVKAVFGQKFATQITPNFDRFKPNLKYNPRGFASVKEGMQKDGVTGPESNLFEKIRTQYSQQSEHGKFLAE